MQHVSIIPPRHDTHSVHEKNGPARRPCGRKRRLMGALRRLLPEIRTLARTDGPRCHAPPPSWKAIAHGVKHRAKMRDRLPAHATHSDELRQHLHTLHTSVEAERTRIARELHDELGQALTALKMDIAWLTRRMRTEPPAIAMILPRLSEMSAFVDATIDSVRRIATDLRPAPLDAMGLNVALETHARRLAARAGLKLYADICAEVPLTLEQAAGLFRIGQEALTNVARHAHASGIWICLSQSESGLELRIRDDGRGIPTCAIEMTARTAGLTGMRERAALLGATFEAGPSPQGGTLVRVLLPITTDPASAV